MPDTFSSRAASAAAAAAAPADGTTRKPDIARILHISDIHCGRGFHDDLWNHLTNIATQRRPHLILVTGDLVNNPYWWTLAKAKKLLRSLETAVSRGNDEGVKVFVIPGNHDTRLTGLIPVSWITPSILIGYVVMALAGYWHYAPRLWIWGAPIAILLLALRYSCLRKFSKFFDDLIPAMPTAMPDLNLVLYPFDSATTPRGGAGGLVPFSQFVDAHKNEHQFELAPFRLALVHHHSVPIPHDSSSEPLMVLKNAGAFLSEAASRGIRLVLSGHKHHQHVSRVTINAETSRERELIILNTGSPTAGRSPTTHGHTFNYIEIHPQSGAQVTQYRSTGGTFDRLNPFWTDTVEKCAEVLYRENLELRGFKIEELEIDITINEDGDAFRKYKVQGFSHLAEKPIREYPVPWSLTVGTGQIERVVVRPNPGSPVNTELDWTQRSQQRAQGRIVFSRPVKSGDDPLGFTIESWSTNAYAMSSQQFSLLRSDQKTGPNEFVEMTLRRAPIGYLTINIKLPPDFKLGGRPQLLVLRGETTEQRFQDTYRRYLTFDPEKNLIKVRIPSPPLGLSLNVAWALTDRPPPAGRALPLIEGQTARIAERLLGLANDDPKANPLSTSLLSAIAAEARREFGLMEEAQDPLTLTIMVFDKNIRRLKIAAGTFIYDDARWTFQLGFGDGIAGRAYKMNTTRLFIKAKSKQNSAIPFYYSNCDGSAPSDTGAEINEEALISLPLSHPDELHATFGILNISSQRQDSRLVNLTDDGITTQFRHAVSRACYEAIKDLS